MIDKPKSTDVPEWATEHILEVKNSRADVLSLPRCGLSVLPEEVLELYWLKEMRLDGNFLRELPKELELFRELSRINIIDNPIEKIPKVRGLVINIEQMVSLSVVRSRVLGLCFRGNNCVSIADYLNHGGFGMPGLREIYLRGCHLEVIPNFIFELRRLEILSIHHCGVKDIPDEIGRLAFLRILDLKHNSIVRIPQFLCGMDNLRKVNLEGNFIAGSDDIRKALSCFDFLCNGKWLAKLERRPATDSGSRPLESADMNSAGGMKLKSGGANPNVASGLRNESMVPHCTPDITEAEPSKPTYIIVNGDLNMGDNYTNHGQAGAMGPKSKVRMSACQQYWLQVEDRVDLVEAANELANLRVKLQGLASSPKEHRVVAEVAAAQDSAEHGDGPSMLANLAGAGKWALQVAKDMQAGIAVELLKFATGAL